MTTAWNDIFAAMAAARAGTPERKAPAPEAPPVDERLLRPANAQELARWCGRWLGVTLPAQAVCPEHHSPLDYLKCVFFEEANVDPVVWACRGGGKTLLGAVATLLDMLFKPGIEVRILGGSQVQSDRMYEHLVRMVESRFRDQMIRNGKLGRITKTGLTLANGSRVELLGQSETSVRGARVQKVRCDEVDLFTPEVWGAVQLTTRSKPGMRGTVEALSTMNGPGGVMKRLVQEPHRVVFSWCIWDVIEKCTEDCKRCILYTDCRGKAHAAAGFVPVADVRTMRQRTTDHAWRYEMLCNPRARTRAGDNVHRRPY
jgi:hypothetical protein